MALLGFRRPAHYAAAAGAAALAALPYVVYMLLAPPTPSSNTLGSPLNVRLLVLAIGWPFAEGIGTGFTRNAMAFRHGLLGLALGVAGVAFAFSGLSLHCLMWPNNIAALGWMPWVVWLCWNRKTNSSAVRSANCKPNSLDAAPKSKPRATVPTNSKIPPTPRPNVHADDNPVSRLPAAAITATCPCVSSSLTLPKPNNSAPLVASR
jgi:hypothetical protein